MLDFKPSVQGVTTIDLTWGDAVVNVERLPFCPSCIKKVKNLVSKENTHAALVSIGTDEVTSHINVIATQAFEVKTQKAALVRSPQW